jgi:fermentation-respiration switch protein FrsA (DUF1100 family)
MPHASEQSGTADGAPGDPTPSIRPGRRRRRWRLIKWAVRLAFLALFVGWFLVGFDSLFYYPTKSIDLTPDELGLEYEDVTFPTSDGLKLSAWFLPAAQPAMGTVIHYHGNAANISNHILASYWLVWEGYNLLVFDYRGYGESQGSVTRAGTIRDGHAALDYVLSRSDVDPERIFAFGQSLGGAVATVVAAEREEIRAVVLDSTFSSYRRIGSRHLQKSLRVRWLCDLIARLGLSGDYEPIEYVARIAPRPILVIASAEDEICFPELGRELYAAASEPKEFVLVGESAHLQTVAENVDNVREKIMSFFDSAVGDPK